MNELITELHSEVIQKQQKINELNDRIDKAIIYIEMFPSLRYSSVDITNGKKLTGKCIPTDELIEILKGGSND